MRRTLLSICSVAVLGGNILFDMHSAEAKPLTSASIQRRINTVKLMLQGKSPRDAQLSDVLRLRDALSTGRSSQAQLKFNDGSVARVGELALFSFVPNTREFNLRNGTALFIIPPKQGRTYVSTPHGSAGIRGSALFVRMDAEKGITIIGALTNNPDGDMEISTNGGSQNIPLKAGQIAIISGGKIELFKFDLKEFYRTSKLAEGLNLDKQDAPSADPDVAKVQAETLAALAEQTPLVGNVIENPSALKLSAASFDRAMGIDIPRPLAPQPGDIVRAPDPTNIPPSRLPDDAGSRPIGSVPPPEDKIISVEGKLPGLKEPSSPPAANPPGGGNPPGTGNNPPNQNPGIGVPGGGSSTPNTSNPTPNSASGTTGGATTPNSTSSPGLSTPGGTTTNSPTSTPTPGLGSAGGTTATNTTPLGTTLTTPSPTLPASQAPPTTSPNTVTPTTPNKVTPTTPTTVAPTTPTAVTPTTPTVVAPTTPNTVTPTTPTVVAPTTPNTVTPTTPTVVAPTAPTAVIPTTPTVVAPTTPTAVIPTTPTVVAPTIPNTVTPITTPNTVTPPPASPATTAVPTPALSAAPTTTTTTQSASLTPALNPSSAQIQETTVPPRSTPTTPVSN